MEFLTVIGFLFLVVFIANKKQSKSNKEYEQYLEDNGLAVSPVVIKNNDHLAIQRWDDDGGNNL